MIPHCSHCGNPWKGTEGSLCPACRLQRALPTAGELYAEFTTRFAGSPPSRFEALCQKHPQHADELRLLHEMALSARRPHDGSPHYPPAPVRTPTPTPTPTPNPADPGHRLDVREETWPSGSRYRVEGLFEQAGLGLTYAVRDRELDRVVAMKVIGMGAEDHPFLPMEELPPAWVERFIEQAQILAQLEHPGIVPIHELGLDPKGRLYFTTRRVRGRCLSEVVRLAHEEAEGWNISRVLRAFLQACETVAHAHQHGILHRDLHPDALLVGDLGEVYVIDWDLARFRRRKDLHDLEPRPASASVPYDASGTASTPLSTDTPHASPIVTRDGTVLGTPAYMPPEQAQGRTESLGPRSDVYSLGAILYELLAGNAPYLEGTPCPSSKQVLDAIRAGPPTPIVLRAVHPLHGLMALCNRAMERNPLDRYADAGELAQDLRQWLDGLLVPVRPDGTLARIKAWILRDRSPAAERKPG